MTKPFAFWDMILQDFWVHFAGLIVIAFGIVDLWYFKQLAHDTDLLFVIGGVAGMGLKIANGTTSALREVTMNTAFAAQRAADAAATMKPTVVVVPELPSIPPAPASAGVTPQ